MEKITGSQISGHSIGENGPLHVEIMADGLRAVLLRSFVVKTRSGRVIEVPLGTITDFASVPRIFWRIIPPWGSYSPAAVVHDWLYQSGIVERKEADDIFLELMERLDVPKWDRTMMYWAVRLGGGPSWDSNRKPKNG